MPEDSDTADALRSVMHRLTAEDFLVVSGDLVSDVPIGAVAATHRRQGALVTALLCNRASLGSLEPGSEKTKREPVSDIIGLDSTQQHLLYVSPGPEVSLRVSCYIPRPCSVLSDCFALVPLFTCVIYHTTLPLPRVSVLEGEKTSD